MPKLKIWKPSFLDYLGAIMPGLLQGVAGGLGARQKKKEEEESAKLLMPMIEKAFGIQLGKEIVAPGTTSKPILPSMDVPPALMPLGNMQSRFDPFFLEPSPQPLSEEQLMPESPVMGPGSRFANQFSLRALAELPSERLTRGIGAATEAPVGTGIEALRRIASETMGRPGVEFARQPPDLATKYGASLVPPGTELIPGRTLPGLTEVGTTPGVYKYDPAMMPNLLKILPTLALLKTKEETPEAKLQMDQLRAKLGLKPTYEPPAVARAAQAESAIGQEEEMQRRGLKARPETATEKRKADTAQKALEILTGIAANPNLKLDIDAKGQLRVTDIRKAPIGEGMGPAKPTAGEIKGEQLEAERKHRATVASQLGLTGTDKTFYLAHGRIPTTEEGASQKIAGERLKIIETALAGKPLTPQQETVMSLLFPGTEPVGRERSRLTLLNQIVTGYGPLTADIDDLLPVDKKTAWANYLKDRSTLIARGIVNIQDLDAAMRNRYGDAPSDIPALPARKPFSIYR